VLAYVFWHWKSDAVESETYERLTRDFHASLRERPPEGFRRSACFAIPGAGWIPGRQPAYEDWYLVDGAAALDPLDRAAVAPPHQAPHDAVARAVAGGAGGLYRLRLGTPLERARFASWFRKPDGMAYGRLYDLLGPLTAAGAAVWGRQMVLGPAAEFCLHAGRPLELPAPLEGAAWALSPVWP
jgi:hypothetical protein